jgi:hypothetical protein
MENPNALRKNIMMRVYTLFVLRHLASEKALGAFLVVVALYLFGRFVFVAEVVRNVLGLKGVSAFVTYTLDAFVHTDVAVQATLLLIALGVVLIVRDTLRAYKGHFQFAS